MSLRGRLHELADGHSEEAQQLMCPLCGQTGQPAEDVAEDEPAFVLVGEDHGYPVRRCYLCGSGFLVRGANTEAVPPERWSRIESDYEEHLQQAHGTGLSAGR